jgi:hypothetical protein
VDSFEQPLIKFLSVESSLFFRITEKKNIVFH